MFYSGANAWRCLESVGAQLHNVNVVKTDKPYMSSQGGIKTVDYGVRMCSNHVQSKKDSPAAGVPGRVM